MKTDEIRAAYLDFFEQRGHRMVPSSSLVPANDPTLLFTNAGMVQFKDALTGREQLDYRRAVSCQRCVRAGGKHNDLENVGYTARHQTLFEMLGNFSFGDYFKEDAITWAWEFVTDVLDIAEDRLWVTVHPSDDEARAIWTRKIGLPPARVVDHEDNFWAMGDTGPCGPDSELFYDLGPHVAGGPPGSPDEDGDRYSEFWNLVFPQYDRAADGTLSPLDTPGVDTGMGLERVAAIVQGVTSNYENDLFRQLVTRAGRLAGMNDEAAMLANPSLRVIADHVRAATFLIGDGVMPGNEDRAYVLRRIVRRGLRHGYKLDIREPFFNRLVESVVELMGDAYPVIAQSADQITDAVADEERRFADTLRSGMALLDEAIANLKDKTIPGSIVFKLYDTYGFPADLTADVARERGFCVDQAGFDQAMEAQRARGRAAARFSANLEQSIRVDSKVEFSGYTHRQGQANVLGLYRQGVEVNALEAGESGVVLLDQTPFYAEAGGQVGDRGEIRSERGDARFEVEDTTRGGDQHLHHGRVSTGALRRGDTVFATIDGERRQDIVLNHSATHLLHAALREVLGTHVEQKGSLVAPDRLRFDFSHPKPVVADELERIESLVNERIRANTETLVEVMDFDDAIHKGAIALFGEKYADQVRVLTMGDGFSVELCGGTHVARSGDIGIFHIVSEEGVAAGVRRVEALTGAHALAWFVEGERQLDAVVTAVRSQRGDVEDRVRQLTGRARDLQREVDALNAKLASGRGADLADSAEDVNGIRVLAARVDGEPKSLPATMDTLRDRLGDAVVVLAHVGTKVSLIAGVSKSVSPKVKANDAVRFVAEQVGARGGGRAEMAQAGGGDKPEKLDEALAAVADWVRRLTAPA
ncbi:MAG: alanine--tRNA ligase [Gammaproteobacteria bacterium]|nr:alanine--tRNA ligase [Gammaproteobacteria bacterium]MYF28630.1 alanine--tRNA ligase [Gammaproteobacteria bacterium]MYK46374.1 alanine--tRNA ligase [Gammaproteobacteria bacterium]